MEDSFSDLDTWKSIFDLSDDDICRIDSHELEAICIKVESFHQELKSGETERSLKSNVVIAENLVRRLFPAIVKTRSNEDIGKLVNFISFSLEAVNKLLGLVFNAVELSLRTVSSLPLLEEECKIYLQMAMTLVDLTRDVIEVKSDLTSSSRLIQTIIQNVPAILEISLLHCRHSQKIYEDALQMLEDDLKLLFLKSKASIMAVMAVIEAGDFKLKGPGLKKFTLDLERIQPLLIVLDFHLFGVLSKAYCKFCKSHWSQLCEVRYDALPQFVFFCQHAEKSIQTLRTFITNLDESGLKRETNILSFLLKMIKQMVKLIGDSLTERLTFNQTLLDLVSTLSTLDDITTTCKAGSILTNDVNQKFPKLVTEIPGLAHGFTLSLASDPEFADFILNLDRKSFPSGSCIFLAKILAIFWSQTDVDLTKIWFLDHRKNLFQVLMSSMAASHVLMCRPPLLPGVQYCGKPLTSFTAYEFVLTRTQSFIAGLSPDIFEIIESTLIKTLLDAASGYLAVQFCLDVWAFLARYGPPDLCCSHVQLLMEINRSICQQSSKYSVTHIYLETAVHRLFAFLSPEDMAKLKRMFSLAEDEDNIHIWKLISGPLLVKNKIPVSDLHSVSVLRVMQLADGKFSPNDFFQHCASAELLFQHWDVLPQQQQKVVSTAILNIWSKLDQSNDEHLPEKAVLVPLLKSLCKLTDKILQSGNASSTAVLPVLIRVAMHQLPVILDRVADLMVNHLSTDLLSIHLETVVKATRSHCPLSLIRFQSPDQVLKFSNPDINEERYLEQLAAHSTLNCRLTAAKPITASNVRKRKLLEDGDFLPEPPPAKKDSNENLENVSRALAWLRTKLSSESVPTKTNGLNAIQTLEAYVKSLK